MTASNSESASKPHKGSDSFVDNPAGSGLAAPPQEKYRHEREKFVEKLKASQIPVDRFTRLDKMDKSPAEKGWQSGCYPDEVGRDAGVLAGRRLMNVDLDTYDIPLPDVLKEFLNERPSLLGDTPHGGERGFYTCPSETPEMFDESLGRKNPTYEWGEIQTGGKHVVAPGSKLDHANCNTDRKPCDGYGSDVYHLCNDRDIRHLDHNDVEQLIEILKELRDASPPSTNDIPCTTAHRPLEDHERAWWEGARGMDEYLDNLCTWAEQALTENAGRPKQYGLRFKDRSRNEVALAEKLLFQFGVKGDFQNPEEIVVTILNEIRPPKWQSAGETYRTSVIANARAYTIDDEDVMEQVDTQEGAIPQQEATSSPPDSRGVVQHRANEISLIIRYTMGEKFTTRDIQEWIDVSDWTIRQILNTWREAGYIRYDKHGDGSGFWREERELPTGTPIYDAFLDDNFHTTNEIRKMRHNYLRDDDLE